MRCASISVFRSSGSSPIATCDSHAWRSSVPILNPNRSQTNAVVPSWTPGSSCGELFEAHRPSPSSAAPNIEALATWIRVPLVSMDTCPLPTGWRTAGIAGKTSSAIHAPGSFASPTR